MENDAGILSQVASWIEYPFSNDDEFPWKALLLFAGIVFILIIFMHDGVRIMSDTVGEIVT
jgi:hypothetical protein